MPNSISFVKSSDGGVDAMVTDELAASSNTDMSCLRDQIVIRVNVDIDTSDYSLVPFLCDAGEKVYLQFEGTVSGTANLVVVDGASNTIVVASLVSNSINNSRLYTVKSGLTSIGFYTSGTVKGVLTVMRGTDTGVAINTDPIMLNTARAYGMLDNCPIDFINVPVDSPMHHARKIDDDTDYGVDSVCSGFVPVCAGDIIMYKMLMDGNKYYAIEYYDAEHNCLSSSVPGVGRDRDGMFHISVVPSDAAYMNYCVYFRWVNEAACHIYRPKCTAINNPGESTSVYGYRFAMYLNIENKWVHSDNAMTTGIIPIGHAHALRAHTGISEQGYAITFYDANFSIIDDISVIGSGWADGGNGMDYYIDLSGSKYMSAKYVGVCGYDTQGVLHDTFQLELIVGCTDCGSKAYTGKKVLLLGDSITALGDNPRGWPRYFKSYIAPSLLVNVAVSGATFCDRNSSTDYDGNPIANGGMQNVIGNQVEKILRGKDASHPKYSKVDDYEDFDAIFIAAGTNDSAPTDTDIDSQFFSKDVPIPIDKIDRTTWAGAVRYAYEKLRGVYPNAVIFVCTPIQASETIRHYDSIVSKGNVLKSICNRISDVVLVDTFKCGVCGVYEISDGNGRDLNDGLHPNSNGAIKIAKYNAREFMHHLEFEEIN